MIDIDQALQIVLAQCRPLDRESVSLANARFRTLANPVSTDIDQPPFDRSLMDGFAVRAADTFQAPASLAVVGQIAAGQMAAVALQPGQAMQINTGAPIPTGSDAVVRIEDTDWDRKAGQVVVNVSAKTGQAITPRGRYRKAGELVLPAGVVLTPPNVAVCASAGAAHVEVHRRPRVAILVTGDELVDVSCSPSGGKIRNSNQYLLDALVSSVHCSSIVLDTVPDKSEEIQEAINRAGDFDVLCLTGGVSMGEFDFVPTVLAGLGAVIHFHKISIKPGRPSLFATLPNGRLVFGLPGNPVSAMIGFRLLVQPALAALQGRHEPIRQFRAILDGKLPAEGSRRAYYPAMIGPGHNGEHVARLLSWHGSGDALGIAGADSFIVRAPDSSPAASGEIVDYIPLA